MNQQDIQKWIDALRSGKYTKSFGVYSRGDDSYCALGLAKKYINDKFGTEIYWNFFRATNISLVELNDDGIPEQHLRPFTFDEIADLLQAVYIEKVLE